MSTSSTPSPRSSDSDEEQPGKAEEEARTDLDRSLVHGVAWTGGIKWLVQLLTWAGTIFVMRLLTPEDYGLVGMAALFLGVVELASQFGLGASIVALRKLTPSQLAQLNTLAVLVGVVALVVAALGARPVAAFFDSPRLVGVVTVLGTTFLISAFKVVPAALLRRDLRYKTLAAIEAVGAVIGVGSTLAMAWAGLGYWALVLGQVVEYLVGSLTFRVVLPQAFSWPRLGDVGHAIHFSSHVFTSQFAWWAYSNADYLIIGKRLGQVPLGNYTSAFNLSRMPAEKISGMAMRVTPGIFSAVQDDPVELRRYVLLLTEGLSVVTLAPIIGLGLVAPELIPLLLGDAWLGAILPLQILAVGAGLTAFRPLLPQVLTMVQETRFPMKVSLAAVAIFLPSFWFSSRWGVAGVAVTWVVLEPFAVALPLLLKIRQVIGLPIRAYLRSLWPAVSSVSVMAGVVLAVRRVGAGTLDLPLLLGAEVMVGALAYVALLLLLHRSSLNRLHRAVKLLRA